MLRKILLSVFFSTSLQCSCSQRVCQHAVFSVLLLIILTSPSQKCRTLLYTDPFVAVRITNELCTEEKNEPKVDCEEGSGQSRECFVARERPSQC